jgi:transmembrane sensor
MSNLDQLGRHLAELQDRHLAGLANQELPVSPSIGEHLLRRATARRHRRRMTTLSIVAVLLVGGGVVGLRGWSSRSTSTLATVRAQAGQRIAASSLDVAVDFADGSRVVLASGASMHTDSVGPSSATVELERGRANVRVKHTEATRWTVLAGGYFVAVTGTRFSVNWRPEQREFSLSVEEGSVRISGGLLTQPVDVTTGQSVTFQQGGSSAQPAGMAPTAASSPTPMLASPGTAAPEAPVPGSAPRPLDAEPSPKSHTAGQHAPVLSWREQAEVGHYREAVADAERKGFEGICRQASASDLLTLAEAARYAGRSRRAEQALKAVRDRYRRSDDAAVAAFLLGRIAAENRRDHAEAAQWFRTYLAEHPAGRLDREAEGRLLESLAFTDRSSAREAARTYLQRYPTGPHAPFAKNLLGL